MSAAISSALKKGKTFLKTGSVRPAAPKSTLPPDSSFAQAPEATSLFPTVSPEVDGEDCDHDCDTCEVKYPKGWKIDEEQELYGYINGWETHMLVATGKTDWVKDVADESGSVMEAVGNWKKAVDGEPSNGKLMLSASNISPPSENSMTEPHNAKSKPTTVLLLPAFTIVEGVTPARVPELIEHVVATAPTNTTPLGKDIGSPSAGAAPNLSIKEAKSTSISDLSPAGETHSNGTADPTSTSPMTGTARSPQIPTTEFATRSCPHRYLILLCSQKTRDARCGQSAPLLRREFERHLRPLGLYRDMQDERPGGVGIYFISHVGGHKFAANVMVYRRSDDVDEARNIDGLEKGRAGIGEGAQCIWLARVRPEDCEGIVKYTVLQGKVVKPERQLRGGFDRGKGLVSW